MRLKRNVREALSRNMFQFTPISILHIVDFDVKQTSKAVHSTQIRIKFRTYNAEQNFYPVICKLDLIVGHNISRKFSSDDRRS